MHHLFPRRVGWRREIGIGGAPHRDPVGVGVAVTLPKDVAACPFGQPMPRSGAAAIRAEVETDLEAAVRVTPPSMRTWLFGLAQPEWTTAPVRC
jgi:hypothetical protein